MIVHVPAPCEQCIADEPHPAEGHDEIGCVLVDIEAHDLAPEQIAWLRRCEPDAYARAFPFRGGES